MSKQARHIELTEDQAKLLWTSGPEGFEFLDKIKAILEPDEVIVGLGAVGSLEPLDQTILLIERKDGRRYYGSK
jgi:hypothetical protein